MKHEELVSEERIQDLALREAENSGLTGREANDALWVGVRTARAALVELGVVRVEEMDLRYYQRDLSSHPLIPIEWLMEGAVLVRAKRL